jgi:hypothetical protein
MPEILHLHKLHCCLCLVHQVCIICNECVPSTTPDNAEFLLQLNMMSFLKGIPLLFQTLNKKGILTEVCPHTCWSALTEDFLAILIICNECPVTITWKSSVTAVYRGHFFRGGPAITKKKSARWFCYRTQMNVSTQALLRGRAQDSGLRLQSLGHESKTDLYNVKHTLVGNSQEE